MSNNHEIICVLDLKYKQTQVSSSFLYENAVIAFDNKQDPSKLTVSISGKCNIELDELKNIFLWIWEMLYFFSGFFPVLLSSSFDGDEDKFFPKRMHNQWYTTKSLKLMRSTNRLCAVLPETLNYTTLKNYVSLKAILKYPLNSIFAVQSYRELYSEHRFVLAAHAAEGIIEGNYDSQAIQYFSKKQKTTRCDFLTRIKYLFYPLIDGDKKYKTELFNSIGISEEVYFDLIKNTRHFYSHLAKERKRFTKGKEFASDYWILSLAIRMFVLQEIGVNYDVSLFKTNVSSIARWMDKYRKKYNYLFE